MEYTKMSVHQVKDGRWFCKYNEKDEATKKLTAKRKYFGRGKEGERAAIDFDQWLKVQKGKLDPAMASPENSMMPISVKLKYHRIMNDPNYTWADIFDALMKDLDIPIDYRRFRSMVLDTIVIRRSGIPANLRFKVLNKDQFTCQKCGAKAPEASVVVDHIIPIARGGMAEERNLQTLCAACNLGKSDNPIGRYVPKIQAENDG
jgi:hypothetical protein